MEVYKYLKRVVTRYEKRRSREEAPEMTYDLLDVPDDKLTEEQLKIKRRQRLAKGAREARERRQA